MKPSKKQIQLCEFISSIVRMWENTNDISSPTHLIDINEFVYAELDDDYTENLYHRLQDLLEDLFILVRYSDKDLKYSN